LYKEEVVKNGKVAIPEIADRGNQEIIGWYTSDSWTDKWDFENDTLKNDLTLYGYWDEKDSNLVRVTYLSCGEVYSIQKVEIGSLAPDLTPNDREGYTFYGWVSQGESFDFNTEIYSSLSLTALWKAVEYTVSFYAEGNLVSTQLYTIENKSITVPKIPEKLYYKSAWSSYTLTGGDVRVDAVYSPITYTATYIVDGETYETIKYNVEDNFDSFPTPPEKEGYTAEWDKEFYSGDVTVYAVYTPIIYSTTYLVNGSEYHVVYFTIESAEIYVPDVPYLKGYIGEWVIVDDSTNDVILSAEYSIASYTASFYIDDVCVKTYEYDVLCDSLDEPEIPDKTGYNKAWDDYMLNCTDIVINAIYTPIIYTAYFYADEKLIDCKTFTVENKNIIEPDIPEKKGYTASWEEYSLELSDISINAKYTIIEYTISFIAEGEVIESQKFNVLTTYINLPEIPSKRGFNAEWENFILDCQDIDVNAVYTISFDVTNLTFELSDDESFYTVTGYVGDEKDIVIPSQHDGVPVKAIGECAFLNCSIESVYICFGVEKIEKYAFAYCMYLLDITLPESLKTIGERAFEYCQFTSITLPKSLEVLDEYAFTYCEKLTEIVLPQNLTKVGDYSFCYCKSLRKVTICDGVEIIGDYAFAECINIETLTLGNTVTEIGEWAFSVTQDSGDYTIQKLFIPKSVKVISAHAFERRVNIVEVQFEEIEGWNLAQSKISPSVLRIDTYELRDATTSAKTFYKHTDLYWLHE
jgi:hypothetical protein